MTEELVYVQDKYGNPLMPTSRRGKVTHMLRDGRAVIISYEPFTIRLTYELERVYVQECSVGVDTGSKHVGVSVTTKERELFCLEANIRGHEVKENLDLRRANRRARRSRKCRHRKPRFSNRKASKKPGWTAPSIDHRIETHKKILKIIDRILPIPNVNLEIGSFDTQKIENPDIKNEEYQHGQMEWFENEKAFVRFRDGNKCAICGKTVKEAKKNMEVHHIQTRSDGGSNRPDNLVCLCHDCHKKLHAGKVFLPKLNLNQKNAKSLRDAAAMNIFGKKLFEEVKQMFPNKKVRYTFGSYTKSQRILNNIEKSHTNDARVISGNLDSKTLGYTFKIVQLRRHNRQIHKMNFQKGHIRKRHQAAKYVNGFMLRDQVLIKTTGQIGYIGARMSTGYADVRNINNKKIHEKTVLPMYNLRLIRHPSWMIFEKSYDK